MHTEVSEGLHVYKNIELGKFFMYIEVKSTSKQIPKMCPQDTVCVLVSLVGLGTPHSVS